LEASGYSDEVVKWMREHGVRVFSRVRLRLSDGVELRGIVMPRPRVGDREVLVLKLDNGYNVGVHVSRVADADVLGEYAATLEGKPGATAKVREGLPRVHFLGTGGTIASRVDYVTGAVYPYFSAEEIYSMIPELEEIAVISAETLFSIFSEDMTPSHWSQLAQHVKKVFETEAPAGIVVAHGTDTMHYSAAALAFAARKLPGPVVFTGAQRSSDRPSSDAAVNVIGATLVAAQAPFAESVIAMHGSPDDRVVLAHRGVRARKMHSSRRDAFMSINGLPLARVDVVSRELKVLLGEYKPRSDEVEVHPRFSDKVALVKFYPGMPGDVLEFYGERGYRGLVLEGTGLGHVRSGLIEVVRKLVKDGVVVVMTTQCLWGRVNMNVYRTGVELLEAGVVPAEDMLPETAFAKLSWILGQTEDVEEAKRLFRENLAYETSKRTEHITYPGAMWWEHAIRTPAQG
jgi:glutamyl-tRNA(Gln) amidotransferase subunit D